MNRSVSNWSAMIRLSEDNLPKRLDDHDASDVHVRRLALVVRNYFVRRLLRA
jgi:hypothetical protein